VLFDHCEEVAEERTLLVGELAGDRIGLRRRRAAGGLPDTQVAAAVAGGRLAVL
jgi:hypothetical protein